MEGVRRRGGSTEEEKEVDEEDDLRQGENMLKEEECQIYAILVDHVMNHR